METERSSNLRFFVVVVVNFEKKVAVLFIRTLFWSPAGLELMENNKWRFKSLITASWTVVVVVLLWMATIACRRSPMCIATNSYPAPPNHFKYVRRNWGYFFSTFNALILTSTLPFTPCQNDKEISRSLFFWFCKTSYDYNNFLRIYNSKKNSGK